MKFAGLILLIAPILVASSREKVVREQMEQKSESAGVRGRKVEEDEKRDLYSSTRYYGNGYTNGGGPNVVTSNNGRFGNNVNVVTSNNGRFGNIIRGNNGQFGNGYTNGGGGYNDYDPWYGGQDDYDPWYDEHDEYDPWYDEDGDYYYTKGDSGDYDPWEEYGDDHYEDDPWYEHEGDDLYHDADYIGDYDPWYNEEYNPDPWYGVGNRFPKDLDFQREGIEEVKIQRELKVLGPKERSGTRIDQEGLIGLFPWEFEAQREAK